MYLIIPELSDFLMLHGRVTPDEVGRLVIFPGLDEVHLVDDYTNCGKTIPLDCIPLNFIFMETK